LGLLVGLLYCRDLLPGESDPVLQDRSLCLSRLFNFWIAFFAWYVWCGSLSAYVIRAVSRLQRETWPARRRRARSRAAWRTPRPELHWPRWIRASRQAPSGHRGRLGLRCGRPDRIRLFFVSFVRDRGRDAALFEQARQTLDADIGGVNTLILLTSSWFVALAVQAAQAGAARRIPRLLAWAAACGLAFAVLKSSSTRTSCAPHFDAHERFLHVLLHADRIHLLHVAAGTVISSSSGVSRAGAYGSGNCAGLESGATFWHMVDCCGS